MQVYAASADFEICHVHDIRCYECILNAWGSMSLTGVLSRDDQSI